MKKIFTLFLSLVFVLCCAMAVTVNAQMQTPEVMLTRFMPEVETELATNFDDREKLVVNYEDTTIALPVEDNALSILTTTEDGEEVFLKMLLPLQEDNISVINNNTAYYDNTDDGFIQTVQVYDKDVLISTSTLGSNSPTAYVYNFDLPANTYMDYLYDEESKQPIDDTIYIFDNSGKILYCIAVNNVRAVSGEKIAYTVELNDSAVLLTLNNGERLGEAVTFSLQASGSYTFAYYFYTDKANGFETYSEAHDGNAPTTEEIRLCLYPNFNNLFSIYTRPDNVSHQDGSWATVYNKFYTDSRWKNTAGMKDQYMCHYNLTINKTPWHLEPWRPNVGWAATVKAFCNPDAV